MRRKPRQRGTSSATSCGGYWRGEKADYPKGERPCRGELLLSVGADSVKAAIVAAVQAGKSLAYADLSDANLRAANLSAANLRSVRDDLWAVLSSAPAEVEGLRQALAEGRVNGSAYEGECACLVGTLANVRGVRYTEIPGLRPNAARPAEQFFLMIRKGNTPETNQAARIALDWVDEWLSNMRAAFGPAPAEKPAA